MRLIHACGTRVNNGIRSLVVVIAMYLAFMIQIVKRIILHKCLLFNTSVTLPLFYQGEY